MRLRNRRDIVKCAGSARAISLRNEFVGLSFALRLLAPPDEEFGRTPRAARLTSRSLRFVRSMRPESSLKRPKRLSSGEMPRKQRAKMPNVISVKRFSGAMPRFPLRGALISHLQQRCPDVAGNESRALVNDIRIESGAEQPPVAAMVF